MTCNCVIRVIQISKNGANDTSPNQKTLGMLYKAVILTWLPNENGRSCYFHRKFI